MFRPNIGTLNALIRITFGLTLVSWGAAALAKPTYRRQSSPLMSVIFGSMSVAEGITRFCPFVYMYEGYTKEMDDFEEDFSPVNPS
ncbi:YgaP family membrane protein [Salipaludibacillus agaradhaerens]|uniref:YgaP family membrane protein n=1 Tax=Salipaludibacillus agaradhaerens TaxID=76935 RepID=UPI000996A050|nr:DUF2892 domain-containing protein [Salipaludibacillus agaradhaerens]